MTFRYHGNPQSPVAAVTITVVAINAVLAAAGITATAITAWRRK